MNNWTVWDPPNALVLGGTVWQLNTDFRTAAAFAQRVLDGESLTVAETFCLFFGDPRQDRRVSWPADTEAALEGIGRFLRREDAPAKPLTEEDRLRPAAYSLRQDADILLADFQRVYGIDLTTAQLHWWRFLALLEGLYSYSFAERVRCRVAEPGKVPKAERRELLRKRKLFAIRRGREPESFSEHMAYLEARAARNRQAEGTRSRPQAAELQNRSRQHLRQDGKAVMPSGGEKQPEESKKRKE